MNKKEIKLISKLILSDNYIVNYCGEKVVKMDEDGFSIEIENTFYKSFWKGSFLKNFTVYKKIKLTSPK